ncbi:MAG: pPIWI_RE module domain-containing protein [Halothece sp.]
MASNKSPIQLFALQVPTQISPSEDLYALTVPDYWKELFNRLQQHKLGRNYVLPPIGSLNQVLQLLVDSILFSSPNAFRLKSSARWLYFNTDKIDTAYIATAVKTWLSISFENCNSLTDDDIAKIHAISGSDLQVEKVQLPTPVWEIKDENLKIDSLYYDLIPYLLANAVADSPLSLVNPKTNEKFEIVKFHEIVSDKTGAKEVISWPPMPATKKKKKKSSGEQEETTHYYSYCATFVLHYDTNGAPYLICDYGIRRWVSWELNYLRLGATVYIKPTNSARFAACKLKYTGKEKGIDFESNLARLVKELNFRDKFTAKDVSQAPYKNNDLAWAVTYNNTMSPSHHTDVGFFPIDHEIFLQACMERFKEKFGEQFPLVEIYSHCANNKAFKKSGFHYKKVTEFIKSHFAETTDTPPFDIPPNLKLVLLAQSKEAENLILLLARKYQINDVIVQELGSLGAELSGKQWEIECKNRIEQFQNNQELRKNISLNQQAVTLTLVEILPKDNFWKNPEQDPKPCFRTALARMGSVTDHFVPKDENDEEDSLEIEDLNDKIAQKEAAKEAAKSEGKSYKSKSLKSKFAHRVENTLLSGLSMAGAYFYPIFEAKNFPLDVASVGVYLIRYYKGEKTQYLPVAVRMDKEGITAKAYGLNDWLDFPTFQVKMASGGKEIKAVEFNKSKIQAWVFNNLFQETKQPTLFCFDAANLRNSGLIFLQKQFWGKHSLAFDKDKTIESIPISNYPNVRVASIISPSTLEVPIYRVCDEEGELAGHTAGVFHPSSQTAECGYYYLSNQRPESRSGGILNESKLVSLPKKRGPKTGELKKPKPHAQGYNPRGVFLNLTLQEGDCFSDWASFVQCLRLYGLIHYPGATTFPSPLHLAAGLDDYRPIHAIREP